MTPNLDIFLWRKGMRVHMVPTWANILRQATGFRQTAKDPTTTKHICCCEVLDEAILCKIQMAKSSRLQADLEGIFSCIKLTGTNLLLSLPEVFNHTGNFQLFLDST